MTNWKIGMKVVRVNSSIPAISINDVVTVAGVDTCACGKIHLFLEEFPNPITDNFCFKCGSANTIPFHCADAVNFRPLQYDSKVNHEVIALFQPLEERSDCPIKKPQTV